VSLGRCRLLAWYAGNQRLGARSLLGRELVPVCGVLKRPLCCLTRLRCNGSSSSGADRPRGWTAPNSSIQTAASSFRFRFLDRSNLYGFTNVTIQLVPDGGMGDGGVERWRDERDGGMREMAGWERWRNGRTRQGKRKSIDAKREVEEIYNSVRPIQSRNRTPTLT